MKKVLGSDDLEPDLTCKGVQGFELSFPGPVGEEFLIW